MLSLLILNNAREFGLCTKKMRNYLKILNREICDQINILKRFLRKVEALSTGQLVRVYSQKGNTEEDPELKFEHMHK